MVPRSLPLALSLALSLLCGVAVLSAPRAAMAQADIDLSLIKDVARAKAEEGLALFAEEKWAEAFERFRVAEELFHAPTLVLHMGHCKRELGQLLAARALYQKVASEEVTEDSPNAFALARDEAVQRVQALEALIPRLTVVVSGVADARVTVDGVVVAQHPASIELDPGEHRVDVVAAGAEPHTRVIELGVGARQELTVELTPIVVEKPRPVPVVVPPPPTEPGSLVPAFIAYGVGFGGLVVGAIAGGIAIERVEAIKSECEGDLCPDRLLDAADEAQLAATVSNVGFIVAGVGAIVGTVLVFARPGGDAPRARLRLGPLWGGVEVQF